MPLIGLRPKWLTFDCYGTLIQWDEGLIDIVQNTLVKANANDIDLSAVLHVYDKYEHKLEQTPPYRSFKEIAEESLSSALEELKINYESSDVHLLTLSIPKMQPFPEVVEALGEIKRNGFKICIISNADNDMISGNVAQLGGYIDRVITAEQARIYKPSLGIFNYAYQKLDITEHEVLHVCASPHIDLAAARDIGFQCVWIDRGTGRKPLHDYTPDCIMPDLRKIVDLFSEANWL